MREGLISLRDAGADDRYPSYPTLRRWIRGGVLPGVRFAGDRSTYVRIDELEALVETPRDALDTLDALAVQLAGLTSDEQLYVLRRSGVASDLVDAPASA